MEKQPVKDVPGLFRDSQSGAMLNCSDVEYRNYMDAKNQKMKELNQRENDRNEVQQLKSDVDELKDMMKLILHKLDK